jgi:hypothetical protein
VCPDRADHWQRQVAPVGLKAHRAGGEGEAVAVLAALLELREADTSAADLARL